MALGGIMPATYMVQNEQTFNWFESIKPAYMVSLKTISWPLLEKNAIEISHSPLNLHGFTY